MASRSALRSLLLASAWFLPPLLLLQLGTLTPLPRAAAQPTSETGGIQSLINEASSAMEAYSYRKAEERLIQAMDLAKGPSSRKHPLLSQVYVMLGVAAVAGSNDLYRGLHYFSLALRVNPKASIPKSLTTPQLSQMMSKARQTVKEIGKPPTITFPRDAKAVKAEEAVLPTGTSGLIHSPIDSAKRGFPIPVKAQIGSDIQAHKGVLFFRSAGTVKFSSVPLKKTGTTFRGAIPPEATGGRYVHYYIEARDMRGRLAGSFGSARSPTVIIVK